MPAKSVKLNSAKQGKIKRGKSGNFAKNKKIEEIEKKKKAAAFDILIIAVIIMCIAGAVYNMNIVAQRNARLELLEKEQNSLRIKREAIYDKLEKSRLINKTQDEDYITGVAKAHGLRKDRDIIFYLYSEE